MRALSLFSGIGGLDLAAESCGIETAAFCEIEPYAVEVLKRRWPGVPIIDDVRKIRGCDWTVDVIHGGFPCQDLSVAGKQKGLSGERSGLWFEMLRVIAECRPAFVLAENVRGAVNLALDTVYAGLEDEGYEVRPYVLPASAVGAPHQRERLFVFGVREDVHRQYTEAMENPGCELRQGSGECREVEREAREGVASDSEFSGSTLWPTPQARDYRSGDKPGGIRDQRKDDTGWSRNLNDVASPGGQLSPLWVEILMGFPLGWTDLDCDEPEPWPGWPALMGERLWNTVSADDGKPSTAIRPGRTAENEYLRRQVTHVHTDQYPYEPPRTVTGCPNRAKRLKCLGNAVVPAQARPFFEAMAQIHNLTTCECFT